MKKGFTLLELIIVILILGILATLAITQYTRMLEKSRGAEARMVLGSIRMSEAAYRAQYGTCASADDVVGIGGAGFDIPGTGNGACRASNYFNYDLTGASATAYTAVAYRCSGTAGKNPPGRAAYTFTLTSDLSTGIDTWISTLY